MSLKELQKQFANIKSETEKRKATIAQAQRHAMIPIQVSSLSFFYSVLYKDKIAAAEAYMASAPVLLQNLRRDIQRARSLAKQKNPQGYTTLENEVLKYCDDRGLELRSVSERIENFLKSLFDFIVANCLDAKDALQNIWKAIVFADIESDNNLEFACPACTR